MKFNLLLSIFSLSLALPAFALTGGSVGNGGDAVVCRSAAGQILNAELLDYYEARTNFHFVINHKGTRDEVLNQLLETLSQTNKMMVSTYRERLADFFDQANMLSGVELVDIPDSEHSYFPAGCKVEQLVIQKAADDLMPGEKTYIVNKDIWDHLDAVNQAGIMMHEVMYRETLGQHSRYIRYLNGLIASNHLRDLTLAQLIDLFKHVGTYAFIPGGSNYQINYSDLDSTGNPRSATVTSKGDIFAGVKIDGFAEIQFFKDGHVYTIKASNGQTTLTVPSPQGGEGLLTNGYLILYPDGHLNSIVWAGDKRTPRAFTNQKLNITVPCLVGLMNFLPSGDLQYCSSTLRTYVENSDTLRLKFQSSLFSVGDDGVSFAFDKSDGGVNGEMLFQGKWRNVNITHTYDSGKVRNVKFQEAINLEVAGARFQVNPGVEIYLYENGQVGIIPAFTNTPTMSVDGFSITVKGSFQFPTFGCSRKNGFTGIKFHPNDRPAQFILARDLKVRSFLFSANQQVEVSLDPKTLTLDSFEAFYTCPKY